MVNFTGNKFLYILGASGSGKTTLAKRIDQLYPEKFFRVVQYTTRPKRDIEIDGVDYIFISDAQYDIIRDSCFETVENQFLPARYGALREDISDSRWNIVVASIEGLFSGIKNSFADQIVVLNIICNGKSFVEREGRDISYEEIFNKSAIYPFLIDSESGKELDINNDNEINYFEININDLKEFSDDELLAFLNKICN